MAYTEKMVATLRENAPLNLQKAKELAGDLGVTYRSIIAKAKQEGIEYEVAQPTRKRGDQPLTKAQLVQELETRTGKDLTGLDKASLRVLNVLSELLPNSE